MNHAAVVTFLALYYHGQITLGDALQNPGNVSRFTAELAEQIAYQEDSDHRNDHDRQARQGPGDHPETSLRHVRLVDCIPAEHIVVSTMGIEIGEHFARDLRVSQHLIASFRELSGI